MEPRRSRAAVFRCEASSKLGGGHVKRCANLARGLTARGWRCLFVTNADALRADPFLSCAGVETVAVNEDLAGPTLLDTAQAAPGAWVVLDHPDIEESHETAVAEASGQCLSFVDRADRRIGASAVVAPGLATPAEAVRTRVQAGCLVMTGPGFAPLGPGYQQAALARERRGEANRPPRVLVSFGLSDPTRAGPAALAALADLARDGMRLQVDYVLGALAAQDEPPDPPANLDLFLHRAPEDLAHLFAACDLAVGAAGTTSVERCALGVAAVVVPVAQNQAENAALLTEAGAAAVVDQSSEALAAAIGALLRDDARRHAMGNAAARLADGFGVGRLAANLAAETDAEGRRIALRRATAADRERLFDWQHDLEMRRYAHNPDPPSWDEHVAWFDRTLADRRRCLNLIETDGTPAGFLRLDRAERGGQAGWLVSVGTAPGQRRKGIGGIALSMAADLVAGEPLFADILPGNAASLRLFEAAGYRRGPHGFVRPPRQAG